MADSSRIQLEVERVKTLARLGELTRELGSIIASHGGRRRGRRR